MSIMYSKRLYINGNFFCLQFSRISFSHLENPLMWKEHHYPQSARSVRISLCYLNTPTWLTKMVQGQENRKAAEDSSLPAVPIKRTNQRV